MPESRDALLPGRARAGDASPDSVCFGSFMLNVRARNLRRGTALVPLPTRAVQVLAYLIAHRDRAVDKDEIVAAVWRDVAVTDDSLIHAISVLRRALGDDPAHPSFIETIPRRGYRFIGALETVDGLVEPVSSAVPDIKEARIGTIDSGYPAWWAWRKAIATVLLPLTIAVISFYRLAERSAVADIAVRQQQPAPQGATIVSGGVVSPIGRHLAFVARDETSGNTALWVRALDSREAKVLPGTESAVKPFWSPDGRTIAFFTKSRLLATDVHGAAVRTIAAIDGAPAGGSWGPNNVIVFADWTTGLYSVAATGGPVQPLTRVDHTALDIAHAWPQFLPDGRRFLYHVISGDASRAGVYAGSIDGPESVRLLGRASAAAYAPPGFLLYVEHDMLMAEPFDASRLRLGGRSVLLVRGVSVPSLTDGHAISGSRDLLAFREGTTQQKLTWVDRSGMVQGALDVPTSMFNVRISPDGRFLLGASSLTDVTGLWLVDLARGESTWLEADSIAPLWSRDGARVAFTARGGLDLYVRETMAEGRATLLFSDQSVKILNDWSPDARHIVYTQHHPDTKLDLWRLPLSGGGARPVMKTSFNEAQARISPDGRWIAFASDQSGTLEVYVRRYPELDDLHVISVGGGGQPQWRADQKELFYLSHDGSLMAVPVNGAERQSFGAPRRLFRTSIGSGSSGARDSYAVVADGQSFLIDAGHDDSPSPITVMLNWAAGLTPAVTPELATSHLDAATVVVR